MKSTFRFLFYMRRDYINKKGETGIMLRITLEGEIAQFSSKLNVNPDNWDTKRGKVTGNNKEARNLNDELEKYNAKTLYASEKSKLDTLTQYKKI